MAASLSSTSLHSLQQPLLLLKSWMRRSLLKQFGSFTAAPNIPTMKQAIEELLETTGAQKLFRPQEYDRSLLERILPKSQEELPPRAMKESYGEILIPIGSDEFLREKYLNIKGGVRFGRILEDLDIFSVLLCYKHMLNPLREPDMPSPFCIVTALVDQIDLEKHARLRIDRDMKLMGNVSWVGKTSIESTMTLNQQLDGNQWEPLIQATFVMAARDPLNRGSAFINPIIPETPEEKAMFEKGNVNKNRRIKFSQESLLKIPPSQSERESIHDIFLSTIDPNDQNFQIRILPENCRWMEEAELKNVIMCHPQERNRFNKIFGGFIMRKGFELAWSNVYLFCKLRPIIIHVDDILFRKPVEIGSLLCFTAKVVYVEGNHIHTKVSAEVLNPETGLKDTTNVFHFTFLIDQSTGPTIKVVPRTYSESMMYLEGKRHFEAVMGQRSRFTS